MHSYVNENGEPMHDLDELSAKGTAGPVAEMKRDNSQSASPESDFFERSPKVKKRRRLVRKSLLPEESTQLDEREEDQSRQPKRKSKDLEERNVRKKQVQEMRYGRERMERDGRRASSKIAKVGSSPSKLGKLARNSGRGKSERVAQADCFQRSEDDKRGKSPWEYPDPAICSEVEKQLKPTQDDDILKDDSHSFEAQEGQEEDAVHMDDDLRFFESEKNVSNDGTSTEITFFVEQFLAKVHIAAEADADLNRDSKPAIEKLKLLPKLLRILEKHPLQDEFINRGILSSIKIWLEPLPDGSLPNLNIRSSLLNLLTILPIDVEVHERREQLKKSKLGRVVKFYSMLPEEIPANKKLARDLVYKWSRPIFQKSTRYEDLRRYDDERPLPRRLPVVKKPVPEPCLEEGREGDEFELELNLKRELQPVDPRYRFRASRPQALPMDFVIRPESKIDAESVRAQAKLKKYEEKWSNTNKQSSISKKLQQLARRKRENLQAARMSVHGK